MTFSTILMAGACVLSTIWVLSFAFCLFVGNQPACARCLAVMQQRYVIGALFAIMMTFFISIFLETRHMFTPTWLVELAMVAVLFFLNASKSRIVAAVNVAAILALLAALLFAK